MKILIVHNYYAETGGEDVVVQAEKQLLLEQGHEVLEFSRTNEKALGLSLLLIAFRMIWSFDSARSLRKSIQEFKPDVVHIHNTFMLISPSVYHTCYKLQVPVVQTWHNYRLLCPVAIFFRNGQVCEECLGHSVPWPAVLHGCWRGSRFGTLAVVLMLTIHRILKTWQKQIDVHIALSEFSAKKLSLAGFKAETIIVKPNFIDDDIHIAIEKSTAFAKDYALYIGRLSPEKGLDTLLDAWHASPHIPLKLIGDGPLFEQVQRNINDKCLAPVTMLGKKNRSETLSYLRAARLLIVPSLCYENFPLVIVEAYAMGIPVVASRLGAMAEIVKDGITGLLFSPGDHLDLAAKVSWAWQHCQEMEEMGSNARQAYTERYAKGANYQILMGAYSFAAKNQKASQH